MSLQTSKKFVIILSLLYFQALSFGVSVPSSDDGNQTLFSSNSRQKRVFSLFNIVTFANEPCRSTRASSSNGFRNGTCFTSTECDTKGGIAAGNCASGFGICCVFIQSNGNTAITQNCSYISNPGFPNSYTDNTAITYTVNKIDNAVCLLRLDFDSFTISGPTDTTEMLGGLCTDTFDVTSTSGSAFPIPQICGSNSGQHSKKLLGTIIAEPRTTEFPWTGRPTRGVMISTQSNDGDKSYAHSKFSANPTEIE